MKATLLIPLIISSLLVALHASPKDWSGWAEWVEKKHPITDAQGHGPDIGSDEWAGALDRRLGITDAAGHGPDLKSEEWRQAVERKLEAARKPAPEETRELLSSHDTVARFEGVRDHKCMGLTSLCPDRCGHSGKLAGFRIVRYVSHEKPGEFGDPRQEEFQVLIEDNQNQAKVPADIRKDILALKPGALVRLQWNHDFVTRGGSSFPERPIVKLSPLTAEEAAAIQGQ